MYSWSLSLDDNVESSDRISASPLFAHDTHNHIDIRYMEYTTTLGMLHPVVYVRVDTGGPALLLPPCHLPPIPDTPQGPKEPKTRERGVLEQSQKTALILRLSLS